MQNRIIGRVLSVDNFRVFIKIEEDIKGAYRSGINDIYEVARINSYLIIPVGSDRIVALITRVTMKEEAEFDKNTASISLPNSARYISATMLGTIRKHGDKEDFIQGVYNFPSLDNPVWYVTEDDLKQIFDDKPSNEIDYGKNFYLPIGKSPAFSNYSVKICPDQFFVKHAAILGNTGSGKSCTLTSILRNLFRYPFKEGTLKNAHIVIFDTNGEYKDAFVPKKYSVEELKSVNAYYYGGEEKVQVPYWLMNWQDFKALVKPSDGAQAPILNRAIGLAKDQATGTISVFFQKADLNLLNMLINHIENSSEDYWKIKNYADALKDIEARNLTLSSGKRLNDILAKIPNKAGTSFSIVEPSAIQTVTTELKEFIAGMEADNAQKQIISDQNIDLPTWFSYKDLCSKFLENAIVEQSTSNAKLSEFVSTLRLRMNSFLNDKRMSVPLMLKDSKECNKNVLPQFLSLLLGDFNRVFSETDKDSFVANYNNDSKDDNLDVKRTSQISIIDVSMLPFEVLETVTALIGRIILEFVSYFLPEQRGQYPIVVVLEEAQNYIAENSDSVAKKVFERIAREGRKYGISLVVSSQRPAELSKTVLSQCNSFVIHRLQNPEDQKYIKGLVSSASADILDQLPVLPQQHAIVTGDCVRTPIQVRIDDVSPTPNSHNPKFVENWLKEDLNIPYEETCKKWLDSVSEADNNANESNS